MVGCQTLEIDYEKRIMDVGGSIVKEGDDISIDGFTGEVILGG